MLKTSEIFIMLLLFVTIILSMLWLTASFFNNTTNIKNEHINNLVLTISNAKTLHGFITASWCMILLYELIWQLQVQSLF